jgi:hypothetical protein
MLSSARGEVEQPTYHVQLEGRTVGPYDRRTIVGMRIKHMLTGDHLLVTSGGSQLTVRDLVGAGPTAGAPRSRSDAGGGVQASYTGMLVDATGRGFPIPGFKGEVEVRVQADALRLAGRYRRLLRWMDGRIKLPLKDIAHARANGPRTDLWLQPEGSSRLQRLGLYLFTSEAAAELAAYLTRAAGEPGHPAAAAAKAAAAAGERAMAAGRVLAVAVLGAASVVALVLFVLLSHRVY